MEHFRYIDAANIWPWQRSKVKASEVEKPPGCGNWEVSAAMWIVKNVHFMI